jgi:amino acid transporter
MSTTISGEQALPNEELSLRQGAIGIWSVMAQAVGHITPLLGLLSAFAFISSYAGSATPICFLIGGIFLAMAAVSIGEIAKRFPSAGGFYTYISRTVHPRAGLFIAWMYLLFSPVQAAIALPFVGALTEQVLKSSYGFDIPWWVFVVVGTLFTAVSSWFGIKISARVLVILSCAELVILIALGGWGIFSPGPGGFNFSSFNPGSAPSFSAIGLGVLYTVTAYAGWESAAPLAEETRQPRRIIPFAMVASIVFIGIVWVLVTWGLTLGWGTSRTGSLATSAESPLIVLARHFWGGAFILIILGLWNSTLAGCQAFFNTSTRMEYAMGRAGVVPRAFAKLHPRYQTPTVAIAFQTVFTLALALGWSAWPLFGPSLPLFFESYALAIALFFIYATANVGVVRYFLFEKRAEFNVVLHLVFPVVSTLALGWATWLATLPPPASAPLSYAPIFFLAWFALGAVIIISVKLAGKDQWLDRAARAAVAAAPLEDTLTAQPAP